jgi:hypothetical protein
MNKRLIERRYSKHLIVFRKQNTVNSMKPISYTSDLPLETQLATLLGSSVKESI